MWVVSGYRQEGNWSIPSLCPCVLPYRQITCRGVYSFPEKPTLFTLPKSKLGLDVCKCRLQAPKRTRDCHSLGEERSENSLPNPPGAPSQLAWL